MTNAAGVLEKIANRVDRMGNDLRLIVRVRRRNHYIDDWLGD